MIGIFTKTITEKKHNFLVRFFRKIFNIRGDIKKKDIFFVHIPNEISSNELSIKNYCSKTAMEYANRHNLNRVYLIYGKGDTIVYDYSF